METEEEESVITCFSCGTECTDNPIFADTLQDDAICESCLRICERCDDTMTVDDDYSFLNGNDLWCISCLENHANYCDRCSEWHNGSSYYPEDRHGSYCEDCIESATWCEGCDAYYVDGCNNCDTDDYSDGDRIVHDYGYRPDPIFYSSSPDERLYFGIEIEVEAKEGDYEVRKNAAQRAYLLENEQLAYLKNDGSLNCGFEIVTHPMSHDYYMNEADELWDTLEDLRTKYDMKSWATRTCGLHIHISRTGFNGGAHMHRFLNLVYSNQAFYELLAGRSSSQWSKFDDVDTAVPNGHDEAGYTQWKRVRSFKNKIDSGRNTDRYSAVNTQNRATLEMRIFKGTINSGKVKSQINLAHASVEYTRTLTVKDVRDGALKAEQFAQYIMAHADIYPELVARLDKQYTQVAVG
jgi:hypothetical protein